MKVKLIESLAADRVSFRPRQVIECSDAAGARLIDHGVGTEAPDDAQADGHLPEGEAKPARRTEMADRAAPEAAVTKGAPAHCKSKTNRGNQCLKAPADGSQFCIKHQEPAAA